MRYARHPIIEQDLVRVVRVVGDCLERLRSKRLLITGGTGFVGTWLLETVSWMNDQWDQPCRVYVPTRNPEKFLRKVPHLNRPDIKLIPADVRSFQYPDDPCDMIIHAAAPADPQTLDRDPLGVAAIIAEGTKRILEIAVEKRIESFLFISSGAVYGTQPPDLGFVPEDYEGGLDLSDPRSAYGEAKRYAEVLCMLYREKFGVPIRIARPFTFVGPYQDLNAGFAVTDFLKAGIQGLPIQIRGDGTTVRSYCYASDMLIALWQILLNGAVGRAYNIGSDVPVTILDLAHIVSSSLSIPVDIVRPDNQAKKPKPSRYIPNMNRVKSEFGIFPTIDIKEALSRMIEWTREMFRDV